jgi:glycosyltransferase involved in cell wall biosynthesis
VQLPPLLIVAHVIHSLGAGGAEMVLVDLARSAPAVRLHLVVVGLSDAFSDSGVDNRVAVQLRSLGTTVYELHAARYDPTTAIRLATIFRRESVDIVHTHLKHADVVGGVAARISGLPSVSTLHVIDMPTSKLHRLRISFARHARRRLGSTVVALSSRQRHWYCTSGGGDASVTVVPNGVAEPQVLRPPEVIRAELGVRADDALALCASLMRPEKGHIELLNAIRLVGADVSVVFALAGDGPLLDGIRSAINSDPLLRDRVRLLGFRSDVADLLCACDFVVHPSLEDALPTALISALASARPIIATDVGGNNDIVGPGCGMLVAPSDPMALSKAITEMVHTFHSDPVAIETFRRATRDWYERRFSAEVWVNKLRTVYDKALARFSDIGSPAA